MGRPRPRANLETQAFRHSNLPTFGRKRNSGSFQPGGPVRGAGCRKMRRQVIGSSAAVLALALLLNGRFASTDAGASSPATRTEPPAGVMAGLQVAAMPTRNFWSQSASIARLLVNLSVRLPRNSTVRLPRNSTAGAPTVSAPQPPASHLPDHPRTRWRSRSKTPTAAHRLRRNFSRRSAPS